MDGPTSPASVTSAAAATASATAAAAAPAAPPLPIPEKPNRPVSILRSSVQNEAELIFSILEQKDRQCISFLDVMTLMRGMGMNPTQSDMDYLKAVMAEPIQKAEEIRMEEERRKEKERLKNEKKDPKKEKEQKDKEAKEKAEAEAAAAEGAPEKKKPKPPPQEEIKNIDWNVFISAVEPIYQNNTEEEKNIIEALKVCMPKGATEIDRETLIKFVTECGESVLSPAEVKQLEEMFPAKSMPMKEFAQRVQGTYVPPTQEELDAKRKAEEERLAAERAAAEKPKDELDGLLS